MVQSTGSYISGSRRKANSRPSRAAPPNDGVNPLGCEPPNVPSHAEPLSCAASDADVVMTFKAVPVLAVWGDFKDAFIDRGLTQCGSLVSRATAAGGKAKLLHLPEEGIAGNSHMLMMDRNNLKVADRIIGWLRESVK